MSAPTNGPAPAPRGVVERIMDFLRAFWDTLRLPAGFWIIILVFAVEGMAYFGALTLMTSYLTRDLGWSAELASPVVSIFTMLVTLFMLGAASYAESFGLRRALLAALLLCVVGRSAYSAAAWLVGGSPGSAPAAGGSFELIFTIVVVALLVVALGEAILQPICYSGIKQFTDERTSSMGYGLIYAFMNLGIVFVGELSSRFRPAVQNVLEGQSSGQIAPLDAVARGLASFSGSGIQAVNWICVLIGLLLLAATWMLLTRRVLARRLRPDAISEAPASDGRSTLARVFDFAEGPFSNARFIFFIFMLLPVRTLFAHQWLTMPEYILRAFDESVANNMERLVNWINPLIIFFGVPIATALTRRVNVYTMMIVGTFVSAAPTFLLCAPPKLSLLITYMVIFSIGEALWSARFLEYASELAPEGRIAQYMGLANVPWLLAKGTTGFYSGYLLATFCPADVPRDQLRTEYLWLIYSCIAMLSPIGLLLARKWVMQGLHTPGARPVAA